MGKWRAHVVLVPGSSVGHVVPFVDLALRIAASRVKVTILTIGYHVPKVWDDAIYGRWAPRLRAAHPDVELVPVNDGIYNGTLAGFFTFISEPAEERLIAAFQSHLAPLMASSSTSPPPCCIISDMMVGWTQDLAAKFNIPRYVMHIQPTTNLSVMLHMPALIAEGSLPLAEENRTKPIEIPGMGFPVHPADLPGELNDPEAIKWGSYEFFLRLARRAREAPIVFVNTFRELEENVLAALDELHSRAAAGGQVNPKVIPIGPLLLPSDFPTPNDTVIADHESEESASLMQWLDTQPPRSVLYIAFGTLVENSKEQMEELAHALEAISDQNFLWSAGSLLRRPNAPQPPPLAGLLPPGFEERTRGRGKIVTFIVPQLRVLTHPACGAFLNHCGWNSALESLAGGVPLVAWPRQFEQRMTARYLVDVVKVAAEVVDARTGFVGRHEIERVVRLVMQQEGGEGLRSRAGELKQIIATRYSHSNPNLDAFLAGLISQSSNRRQ